MPDVPRITGDIDPKTATHRVDRAIATLAARQHGVVARRQLAVIGVSETMLRDRLRSGRLLRLHRGVYAVGHRQLRRQGYWLAAVLAVGPGAALSHRDAAALHAIRASNTPKVDVTTTASRKGPPGVHVHQTRVLYAQDITTVDGIPVTTVARTLVDLAGVVPKDHLAKAVREAEHQRTLDTRAIEAALQRTRGRRGPGHDSLKKALAEHASLATTLTRSPLEVSFQRLVQRNGLPRPQTNVHIEGYQVDAVWPPARLVVELDGYEHHRFRHAFQRDRERDVRLQLAGYRVLRFTHDHVVRRPHDVAAAVRDALVLGGLDPHAASAPAI